MHNLLRETRYALRQFGRAPIFTAAAVLTLALGIGGTTAIFSLMHTVMLRSLPVADPASLYRIGDGFECCVEGGPQDRWGLYSYPLFQRLSQSLPEFEELAAFQAARNSLSVRREGAALAARPLGGEFVTGNYFNTFGIQPFAGRLFSAADDQPSAPPVAVLSYRAWRGTYGGDPSVIGSTFVIDGHAFSIIGVAPPGFFGETLRPDPADLWIPLHQEPLLNGQGSFLNQPLTAWLRVIGRLRPGASVAGVGPRLTEILRHWMVNDSGYPAVWLAEIKRVLPRQVINVVPAGAGVAVMKEEYGRSLQILLSVCGVVLLIACANVANLLLARGMARRNQTAVRLALGASRAKIISQALLESVLLSLLGGLAGLVVAVAAARLLLALAFHSATFLPITTTPSLPVLGFAFLLSLLTGAIFGTAPAWFATHSDPIEALRGNARSTRDRASFARKALLVLQATFSVVLVASAAMLTRSLGNLEHQNFGYQVANRVEVALNPPPSTYTPERLNALYRESQRQLSRMPGIDAAELALYNPLTDNWGEGIFVEGHPDPAMNEQSGSSWDRVSAGYLQALGVPVIKGRGFDESDNETAALVAVVNQAFVRRFFPNEDPLDRHFGIDLRENAGTFRIVGVVGDAKFTQPTRPARPMFYVPLSQFAHYDHELLKKIELRSHYIGAILLVTPMDPGTLEPMLRKTLAQVDPNLTVTSIRTMQQQVELEFDQQRALATLAGLFGAAGLLLAAVGLYGVTAFTVAQRTNEIGVRMALGADRVNVVRLVLQGALRRVMLGLLLGIPLAIGAGRLIASKLFAVSTWDPLALAIAAGSLGICALIAAAIPALRAASISPMDALRTE